jgi:hypothetical protein
MGFPGQHGAKEALQSHGVAADTSLQEKRAGALPFAGFIADLICAVITPETCGKIGKGYTVWLAGITFGFFDLTDKA